MKQQRKGLLKYVAYRLLCSYLILLLGTSTASTESTAALAAADGQDSGSTSKQPFFVPDGPGFTVDLEAILRYIAPFFIIPVVLGILGSIYITLMGCLSCCCPKCLCSPPCCFGKKKYLAFFYTLGFLLMVAGSIISWVEAPLVQAGVSIIFDGLESLWNDLSDWILSNNFQLSDIGNKIKELLIPAMNASSVKGNNELLTDNLNKTRGLFEVVKTDIYKLEGLYGFLKGNLALLEEAKSSNYTSASVPSPTQEPNPLAETYTDIITFEIALSIIENDSSAVNNQFETASPLDPSFNTDFMKFPNFTLPFEFDSFQDGIDFAVNKILELTGLTNPLGALNQTLSSVLPSLPSTSDAKSFVQSNGGLYTFVVAFVGVTTVVAHIIWYFGLILTISFILRGPLCWSAFIIIPLGLVVGFHLAVGTITDQLCVYNEEYINYLLDKLLEQASNSTSSNYQVAINKIKQDPDRILTCSGNETIFSIYGIDVMKDFGFQDKIDELLNGTTLNFLSENATDLGFQKLLVPVQNMTRSANRWIAQLNVEVPQYLNISVSLQEPRDTNNCSNTTRNSTSQCTSSSDNCCFVEFYVGVAEKTVDLGSQIGLQLSKLIGSLADLQRQLDVIAATRKNLVDSIKSSLFFPDLDKLGNGLLGNLAQCSIIGSFYSNIFLNAICSKVSPGLLYVGWGLVAVGLGMLYVVLLIFWSTNLKGSGMIG